MYLRVSGWTCFVWFQRTEVRTKECNLQQQNYKAPRRAGNRHRGKGLVSGEHRGFSPLKGLRGHLDDVCMFVVGLEGEQAH